MPTIQDVYGFRMPVGFEGTQANMEPVVHITRTVTGGPIRLGRVVVQGETDMSVKAPAGTYRGLAIESSEVRATGGVDQYPAGSEACVAVKGVYWVRAVAAVTAPGTPAFYAPDGTITPTAGGGTPIPNAIFDSTGAAGALVKLRLQ